MDNISNFSILDSIQLVLVIVLIGFAFYYVYDSFFGKAYQPRLWKLAVKNKKVSPQLVKAEAGYKDSIRFFSWWFHTERLKNQAIAGDFAELGVYKGDSAAVLHLMDETRNFHLFDTFNGFQEKDLQPETGKAAGYTSLHFADTSAEQVKKRLNSDKFILHEGDFSETKQQALNKQFALVNMDVDLYEPTREGLAFFYPRMVDEGVIFVHDYNPDWPGIIKAVDDFCKENKLIPIHIPDMDDTVIILKENKG